MLDLRRARLGIGACALVLTAAVAFALPASPGAAQNTTPSPSPAAKATPVGAIESPPATGSGQAGSPSASSGPQSAPTVLGIPAAPATQGRLLNRGQPTPYPLNTLAPLGSGTPLPFPAYGTPVPGVNAGTPPPDAPATVSLQQAIAIGFARNPLLAIARGDVDVQAAAVRLDRAGLLPSFSGSSAVTYTHDQLGTVTTGGTTAADAATFGVTHNISADFGLSLAQLIYDGGKIAASVNAARSTQAATVDNYRRELQTVAYDVANAYYAYLGAQRLTQVDLEIVREDVVQENLVRAQVRAGTSAQADIATTELPTAQARLAVVRAQGAELSAEATFVNAMGLDANDKVQPVDDAPVFTNTQISSVPIPTYDVAIARALALRPDYDAAVRTIQSEQYSLKAAKLGLFPTLSASAAASDATSGLNASAFRNSQQLGLALSLPIYDQGVTAANVASARAQLGIGNATLQNTALGVQLNVKQALSNLVAARAALDETQQEYATAVVNVQSTQAQYRAGVTTLPLLLNAQVQLTQALTDQVTAVYTLRENEQAYLYAVGANYDPAQYTLPHVAKTGKGDVSAQARPTLLQRLEAAIH